MVFLKWIGITIAVLVVIVFAIKFFTRNNDSYDDSYEEGDLENRMGTVETFWDICCRRKKGRSGI